MDLPTEYQEVIYKTRYARWLDEENRRENWDESVGRYIGYIRDEVKNHSEEVYSDEELWKRLENDILSLKVMPSMRALMTAGPALDRCNVAGYNCSYIPVNSLRSFDEAMYILMCGTGVGFSVERQYTNELPTIAEHFEKSNTVVKPADSKSGWARALKELISLLVSGQIPEWDLSLLRPAGSRLKTFGGRSSGPEPLDNLFRFVVETFKKAAGRKLTSLECHDIMCKIGEVVVVGGVRRSALISLSNLSDDRMRNAKSGQWWLDNPQRSLANNSACYSEKPDAEVFLKEWLSLVESKSGERGIFNRTASVKKAESNGRRDPNHEFGTNPCSEIILRPFQFCNLSSVVVRAEDTLDTLLAKVESAAILGTFQSLLTNFKYLRKIWRHNTEEERLLGVSLTGILDNKAIHNKETLEALKEKAVETNRIYAELLGIPQSAAVTCVKPEGTSSQLTNSSSGIHARHSPYYIRTVRGDKKDPVTQFLIDSGIPCEDDLMNPGSTVVFSFPIKSPEGATFRDDLTAKEHLEIWKLYNTWWCEHKPSITISVRDKEWLEVGSWVYENFNEISGISFLPHSDHSYKQAPYQECSKEDYEKLLAVMPEKLDWERLSEYEKEDSTTGTQELSCTGGVCEITDIGR